MGVQIPLSWRTLLRKQAADSRTGLRVGKVSEVPRQREFDVVSGRYAYVVQRNTLSTRGKAPSRFRDEATSIAASVTGRMSMSLSTASL